MADKYIYIKLIKKWGGFKIDDIVRFGRNKGEMAIRNNIGIEVSKQNAVNAPMPEKQKPKMETATLKPKVETTEVIPQIKKYESPKKSGRGRPRKMKGD